MLSKLTIYTVLTVLFIGKSYAQLHANFSALPTSGCSPLVVKFTDISTGNPTAWKWDLGNGTTSFLQNPSGTYFNPGTYTVKLIITNSSGADSLIKTNYITVNANPTVNFSANPSSGCVSLPVQFADMSQAGSGTITTWQWDFGDGTGSFSPSPNHIYSISGNYNVSLKVVNSMGCSATITKAQYIHVFSAVHASFTNDTAHICSPPATINFQNLSTGQAPLSYQWFFGDGGTSTATNPSHAYLSNGNFTVKLIVTNSLGCTDTLTKVNAVYIGGFSASFSLPSVICQDIPFTITNTSSPVPTSVFWSFGNGDTSIILNPTKSYSTAGTYTIKLIDSFGVCVDSISRNVTVFTRPWATFTADKRGSCKAPLTVNFTSTSTGAVSYLWDFGDGGSSTLPNPAHNYTSNGSFNVTLTVTNAAGCTNKLTEAGYITIQPPNIMFNYLPEKGCVPLTHYFSANVISPDSIVSYLWLFGDGNSSTLPSPSYTYTIPGIYDITLIVTTVGGCSDTAISPHGISVGIKPQVHFSAFPTESCAFQSIVFMDSTVGTVDTWIWFFGDGVTSALENSVHNYSDTGYFTVTLVAWDRGCSDTATYINYIHILPPIARFQSGNNCTDIFSVNFEDQSIGATSWNWDFGDGGNSTLQSPTHVYPSLGNYMAKLIVSNSVTGCSHTTQKLISIFPPATDILLASSQSCKNDTLVFKIQSSDTTHPSSYEWDFGDGSGIWTGNPTTYIYSNSGNYGVTVKITDFHGCEHTIYKTIQVFLLQANYSYSAGCANSAVTFADNSTADISNPITKWIWDFGDGTSQTFTSPPFTHTYIAGGTFSASLIVVNAFGCRDTVIHRVTIYQPKAAFAGDTLSCIGVPVSFADSSTGNKLVYYWQFGDGQTSTTPNPLHTYNAAGIYSVTLRVTDSTGCTVVITKTNYVRIVNPIAKFLVSDTISVCPPLIATFTNISQDYISYLWDFGDGTNTSDISNPLHFYNNPGSYTVKLTVTSAGGCVNTMTKTLKVNGALGAFSYNNNTGCVALTSHFTATTLNADSLIWDFADGNTFATNSTIVNHTYITPGFYLPKMILIDSGGCQIAVTGIDTIKVYGVNAFFKYNKTLYCDSAIVSFTDSSYGNDLIISYNWNFGDGTFSPLQNPTHTWYLPGSYMVTLTITTLNGCTSSYQLSEPLKIYSSPKVNMSAGSGLCAPALIPFSAQILVADTLALAWHWDFGNGNTSNIQNTGNQLYTTGGNYTATLTVTNNAGCVTVITQPVQVYPVPDVNTNQNSNVCRGQPFTLLATGANNYVWSPAIGLTCSTCATTQATPDSTRMYYVTGSNLFGCSAKDSILLTVIQHYPMSIGNGDTLCLGESTTIRASGAFSYVWSPNTGLSSTTSAQPIANPSASTTYRVVGYDQAGCFTDTGYVYIRVNPLPNVNAGADKTINAGHSTDLVPTLSPDAINVTWTPPGSIISGNYPAVTVKPNSTTEYTVDVENIWGCKSQDKLTVFVICNNANVYIPNTFSPNHDGRNDVFYIRGMGIAIRSLRIFNRWGELVFERENIMANDKSQAWDGAFKGKALTPDVFVYIAEVVCDNNEILSYKGNVALIR